MTGYTRADSVNNIADGNIINASDLDGEFDAVQAAFNSSTGHVHDGTAANGAPITKIGPTQDVVASATAVTPKTTATVDVGSSALKFKDFFFSGTGTLVGLTGTGAITLNTTTNNQSYTTTGAGTITISSGTTGTIDGMNIGATTAGTGRFSSITNTGLTSGRVVYSATGGLETDSAGLTFDGTNFATTGTATAAKLIPTGSSATGNGLYLPATNSVGISTAGTNAVYIDSTQNVGIGTSSPVAAAKMTVQGGGANGTGGIRLLSDNTYANGANYVAYGRRSDGNPSGGFAPGVLLARVNSAPAGLVSGINLGRLAFGGSYDGTDANVVYGAQIAGYSSGTYSSTSAATDLLFFTTPSGTAGGTTTGLADFGTERMRIDSSGNVGIGTSSPATRLTVANVTTGIPILRLSGFNGTDNSNYSVIQFYNEDGSGQGPNIAASIKALTASNTDGSGGQLTFSTSTGLGTAGTEATERMRIDSSGNVGIGTSSPTAPLSFSSTAGTAGIANKIRTFDNGASVYGIGISTAQQNYIVASDGNHCFYNVTTERMRIDSSGNLLVGRTGTDPTAATGILLTPGNTGNITQSINTATNSNHYLLYNLNATNTGYRFYVNVNGGIYNYSANNVNLSDRREKTNFAPAGDYLSKICAIPIQTYNYIDQNLEEDGGLTLGVVAQDVQVVAPELVNESNWGTEDEPKMRLSIYQTDLQYALMKCIQEQQALITSLTARIEALEST
jgi:hypothetical protein